MKFRHKFDIEQICDFIRRAALELGYDPNMPANMLRPAMNADGIFFTHVASGFYCYKLLTRCVNHGPEHDQDPYLIPHITCPACRTIIIGTLLKKDVLTDKHEADVYPQGGLAGPTKWYGNAPRVFTGLKSVGGTNGHRIGTSGLSRSKIVG